MADRATWTGRCRRGLHLCALAVLASALLLPLPAGASSLEDRAASMEFYEYEVKAAFLFRFAEFVEWPETIEGAPAGEIVIGILGDDPFNGALDPSVHAASISASSVSVRRFRSVDDLEFCHILFVCRSESKSLPAILKKLEGMPVLTVGETDRFSRLGGMITFIEQGNSVRFEIDAKAAKKAGLKISSKLLRLGTMVRDRNGS